MNKKNKTFVRVMCVVLCVLMVGGLFTSALVSVIAQRKAARGQEIVEAMAERSGEDLVIEDAVAEETAEDHEDHDHAE